MPVLPELSDHELLIQLRQDNALAFDQIYQKYWQTLYAIAYNRLKDSFAAEDIVHDVLALIWKRRKDLMPDSLSSYLCAAVKYAVLSHIRKQGSAQKYLHHEMHLMKRTEAADMLLHHKRILQMVSEEIDKLPEKCRLIFKCSRENGMSTKEIAKEFNISDKTVENQINKALRHLKYSLRNSFLSLFWVF